MKNEMAELMDEWAGWSAQSVVYHRVAGFWNGPLYWAFALGAHHRGYGVLLWSWFAMGLTRDLQANRDRAFTITVAGRSLTLSWNWSPWSYPETEWRWRKERRPVGFHLSLTKLARYDA